MEIKVLIVDDSEVNREFLKYIIESDPSLKVTHTCQSGLEAIEWLKTHTADVVAMDLVMPKMDGYAVTRKIMETKPIPIVIVTSTYRAEDSQEGFKAVEAGALAILEKPSGIKDSEYQKKAKEIIDTIKMVKDVKLVRRTSLAKNAPQKLEETAPNRDIQVVAIGSSLGGPAALMEVSSRINLHFPVPILVVQHIVPGFTQGLANWLQQSTPLKMVIPEHGEIARAGYCYLAPDHCHMKISKGNTIMLDSSQGKGIQPSVSKLFESVADTYGKKGVGVILTGMGKDGANELLLMKERGAFTIAQDEKTSVMFGMPAEAIRIGAASKVLPLEQIPLFLNELVLKGRNV